MFNVLLKTGVMEIGRKSACSCGVAVLETGLIDANFHCLGTVEEAIDLLNKRARGPQNTGALVARTMPTVSQLLHYGLYPEFQTNVLFVPGLSSIERPGVPEEHEGCWNRPIGF